MEQKDIDKLLAGRKLILENAEELKAYFFLKEAYHLELLTKITEERRSALSAESQKVDSCLLNQGLHALGFGEIVAEAINDFRAFNRMLCLKEYKKTTTIYGTCDKCEGYTDEDGKQIIQPCVVVHALKSCAVNDYNQLAMEDTHYRMLMHAECIGSTALLVDGEIKGHCPPGHGFYILESEARLVKHSFNVYWRLRDVL